MCDRSVVDWVQCDNCSKWFHLFCIGLDRVHGHWACKDCVNWYRSWSGHLLYYGLTDVSTYLMGGVSSEPARKVRLPQESAWTTMRRSYSHFSYKAPTCIYFEGKPLSKIKGVVFPPTVVRTVTNLFCAGMPISICRNWYYTSLTNTHWNSKQNKIQCCLVREEQLCVSDNWWDTLTTYVIIYLF